ncbi:MAG: sensor domain-containing diguanylate cyclase [Novosphingobium sp.]|nr:sensor domain-containing diguanylate cyclase [Novosphingobium sp.]
MSNNDLLSSLVNLRNWRSISFGIVQLAFGGVIVASFFAQGQYDWALHLAAFLLFVANLMMMAYYARIARDQWLESRAIFLASQDNRTQIEELFAMTDMLQAAEDHEDAGAILESTALRLLPRYGGALYVFNNSRDRLDLAKKWNTGETFDPSETLLPGNCWALKRGKPHVNARNADTLCCMHHVGESATVEVPMMARGQVHGLIMLSLNAPDAFEALKNVRRVARALADSMSLALSNIALREKLRTQSLRDPLTGLYNRRYMEDALERLVSLAERTGSATSVLMIDLDNFKRLNDENGHAKGDAVLRDVAAQLVASLRPSDVVSRYGGEELVVILPSCGLTDAELKAEILRQRIESLTEAHGIEITASIGIATVPETATSPVDVIPLADAALYAAKQAGKNRIASSERRAGKEEAQPRLVV